MINVVAIIGVIVGKADIVIDVLVVKGQLAGIFVIKTMLTANFITVAGFRL